MILSRRGKSGPQKNPLMSSLFLIESRPGHQQKDSPRDQACTVFWTFANILRISCLTPCQLLLEDKLHLSICLWVVSLTGCFVSISPTAPYAPIHTPFFPEPKMQLLKLFLRFFCYKVFKNRLHCSEKRACHSSANLCLRLDIFTQQMSPSSSQAPKWVSQDSPLPSFSPLFSLLPLSLTLSWTHFEDPPIPHSKHSTVSYPFLTLFLATPTR